MNGKNKMLQRLNYFANPINIWKYLNTLIFPTKPICIFHNLQPSFKGKSGVEIGGPSNIFAKRNLLPIYPITHGVDGCNFNSVTLWEQKLEHLGSYTYKTKSLGRQFIVEATNLHSIADDNYDFVISSHCLEHIANPLKAIKEWIRVIKPGGCYVIIVPNKLSCFDHNRPDTSFEHIYSDYNNQVQESDMTHLDEILQLHDIALDPGVSSFEEFKIRCKNNNDIRGMHHHVFNSQVLAQCLSFCGVKSNTFQDKYNLYVYGHK